MQKIKTTKETVERKTVIATFCDFCGREIGKQKPDELEQELKDLYEFEESGYGPHVEAEVKIRMSNSYSEDGGGSKSIEIDVCHRCFKREILAKARHQDVHENEW